MPLPQFSRSSSAAAFLPNHTSSIHVDVYATALTRSLGVCTGKAAEPAVTLGLLHCRCSDYTLSAMTQLIDCQSELNN